MDSERTRNLKELRQKRLQYFDNIKPQSTTKSHAEKQEASSFSQKDNKMAFKLVHSTPTQKPSQGRSILAWESTEETSSLHHDKTSSGLVSTSFQRRIDGGAHLRSSSDRRDVSGDTHLSPLRRSLNQAQTFSTSQNGYGKQNLPGEFRYTFEDFKPVDRDRFFSTKSIEDLTRVSPNSTEDYLGRGQNKTSDQVLDLTKETDTSYDAFLAENMLQEMGKARQLRAKVHNELKTNFENSSSGWLQSPNVKFGSITTKSEVKRTDNVVDVNHNTTKVDELSDMIQSQVTASSSEDESQVNLQDKVTASSSEDESQVNLQDKVTASSSEDESQVNLQDKVSEQTSAYEEESMESTMDDDENMFNLGALQEAAKQGDDVLRKYIKRLSQRLHSKTDEDSDSSGVGQQDSKLDPRLQKECNEGSIQKNSEETYQSLSKMIKIQDRSKDDVPAKTNEGTDGKVEKSNECDLNVSMDTSVNSTQADHHDSTIDREEEEESPLNPRAEWSTNYGHDSFSTMTNGNHQPKIAHPAITSNQLEELGLFEPTTDILPSTNDEASDDQKEKHLAHTQEAYLREEHFKRSGDDLELVTHRPGARPISPLKSVHIGGTGCYVQSKFEFPYIHVPFPQGNSASSTNDETSCDVNMSEGSFEETNLTPSKHLPKPPRKEKNLASRRNVYTKQVTHSSSPSVLGKPSKRPKTPERHVAGVREHHEKSRETRRQSPKHTRRQSSSPNRSARLGERQSRSPGGPEGEKISVANSSFQRGISPESKTKPVSIPSLNLHDNETSRSDDNKDDDLKDAQAPDWLGDQISSCQDDENESLLMQKIADFRPQVSLPQVHHVGSSGDAPISNKNGFPQVSFELPHQGAINDLLGRSSHPEKGKRSLPAVRPSSADPQRSRQSTALPNKTRPSSAKSKVLQYMDGSNQYKRRWATSSSLWGSRSITSAAGDLQVAGQRSKLTDMSKSPAVGSKPHPTSAKNTSDGEADIGSRVRSRRSRPWSASASRQKERSLKFGSTQQQDSQVIRGLQVNKAIPPLTMQLIVDSPRSSDGVSIWQLLPDEILLHIFSYLSHYHLVQCAQTCSLFNRVALDESLWRHIHLENRMLSDFWLTHIGERHPINLGIVQCYGNITENGLRNLFRSCADNLKELSVSGCSSGELSGDSLLLHASRCYKLTSLDASWCNVTDNGLTAVNDSVHELNSLCLNGCREISDQCLRAVINKHGKSLTVLEVFGCFNLSIDTLRLIGEECKRLRSLNIGQCYKLTDDSISHLAPHLKGIKHLDLRGCKQIRDSCIRKLVRHCKKLESLVLANCTHISNTALTEIATYMPNIKDLDLAGCKRVTNEGVKSLATNCHQLTRLDLSSTSIDHRSVAALASYCSKSLQGLKLNCCKEITEASIVKLLKHCKQLETVHLYGVKRLHTLSVLKLQYPCLMYDEKSPGSLSHV